MNDAKDRALAQQITALREEHAAHQARRLHAAEMRKRGDTGLMPTTADFNASEEVILNELCRVQVARLYHKFFPS